jgi:uncharacterized damage-inducible protein DinB
MSLNESLLPELRHEASITRKAIERVPAEKFAWKPHEKSMTFGRLASHIAEIPGWTAMTLSSPELNLDTAGMKAYEATSADDMLKTFDDGVGSAIKALEKASDQQLMENWKMIMGGQAVINMPKLAVLRVWVLNHMIHHRGQLSVYLRENNIPVPSIYGPSADEQG